MAASLDLIQQLAKIDGSTFQNDADRRAVMTEALKLAQRLQMPYERTVSMIWRDPITLIAIKVALDMDLFSHLGDGQMNSKQAAKATGGDPLLVSRIFRMLGCQDILREIDVDTFSNTEFSRSLIDADGLRNGFQHFFDIGLPQLAKLPVYLKETKYVNPNDYDHPPFEFIMHPDEGNTNFWDWLKAHPRASEAFNAFLATLKISGLPSWSSFYPVQDRLLSGLNKSKPLLVDVGGGSGTDLRGFAENLPADFGDAILILQDQPQVIQDAKNMDLPIQIQLQVHDFFKPQKQEAEGARAYFMAFVLHDWPDKQAVEILQQLRKAMTPRYSKILLHETVVADRIANIRPGVAASDINMMAHFAALERTEAQWEALLKRAGLRLVHVFQTFAPGTAVIEAVIDENE